MTPPPPPSSRHVGRARRSRLGRLAAAALTAVAAGAVLVAVPTAPVAAQSGESSGGVVVIANGWSSADVGAAAPLAGRLEASVLYASASSLGDATEQALAQLAPSRVILMGGTVALEAQVATAIRRLLPGTEVTRHSGSNRIDTAAKAALSAPSVPANRPVVIANGWSPSDVGTAAPLAASLGGSVLFANRDTLGDPTVTALNRLDPSRIIIVGGTNALSSDIESQLESVLPGTPTERLAGVDRVDTAAQGAALGEVALGKPVVLANGWEAADVGIAAPLAASLGGSVLFTEQDELGERTTEALESLSPSQIIMIGGSDQLAETIDAELARLHAGTPWVNIAGPDRIATAALAAMFGVQFSAEQQRFEEAVATITPGEADCDAAPQLDVEGIEVIDPPADHNDPTTPLTVAEVVRIAGGCALVDYVRLNSRTVAEVRDLLVDQSDVFAVGEPLRGVESLHDSGAHSAYGPSSGTHVDDGAGAQWHLPADYMQQLWDGWNHDPKHQISVAVIDSGVDAGHQDLTGQIIADHPQMDMLSGCHVTDSWDTYESRFGAWRIHVEGGHGTHVAGIVAAKRENGGVVGVAPDAKIIPINHGSHDTWRAEETWYVGEDFEEKTELHEGLRSCDTSQDLGLVPSVVEALNRGADVINMSWGKAFTEGLPVDDCGKPDGGDRHDSVTVHDLMRYLDSDCDSFRQVLKIAAGLKVVAVAAAGNSGARVGKAANAPHLPAAYDSTIAVAAIDEAGDRAAFSNKNDYVDIAAPGVDILSTVPNVAPLDVLLAPGGIAEPDQVFGDVRGNRFVTWSGTSMASPFVAGVVAHMLNRYPDATPTQVRDALTHTADHPTLKRDTKDDEYGYGRIQPKQAIWRLREIRERNHIESITAKSSICAFDDDTPSCPDPAKLSLRPAPIVNPKTPHRYTVKLSRDVSNITVNATYRADGRPGEPTYFLSDASLPDFIPDTFLHDINPTLAGRQFKLGTGRYDLKVYVPDWRGKLSSFPSVVISFNRAGAEEAEDEPVTEPAESEPRFAALRVWSGSCNRDFGPQKCAGDSAVPTVPTFSPDVSSYTVTVPRGTEFVTLAATPAEGFTLSARSSPPDVARIPGYQVRIAQPAAASTEGKADKPGTSAAIGERFLEVVGNDWSGAVIVASSENFPDGLSAASLAGALRGPDPADASQSARSQHRRVCPRPKRPRSIHHGWPRRDLRERRTRTAQRPGRWFCDTPVGPGPLRNGDQDRRTRRYSDRLGRRLVRHQPEVSVHRNRPRVSGCAGSVAGRLRRQDARAARGPQGQNTAQRRARVHPDARHRDRRHPGRNQRRARATATGTLTARFDQPSRPNRRRRPVRDRRRTRDRHRVALLRPRRDHRPRQRPRLRRRTRRRTTHRRTQGRDAPHRPRRRTPGNPRRHDPDRQRSPTRQHHPLSPRRRRHSHRRQTRHRSTPNHRQPNPCVLRRSLKNRLRQRASHLRNHRRGQSPLLGIEQLWAIGPA